MYLKIHAAVFLSCLFHFEAIKALNPCHAVRNKCHLTVHWLQGTHAGAGPGGDAAQGLHSGRASAGGGNAWNGGRGVSPAPAIPEGAPTASLCLDGTSTVDHTSHSSIGALPGIENSRNQRTSRSVAALPSSFEQLTVCCYPKHHSWSFGARKDHNRDDDDVYYYICWRPSPVGATPQVSVSRSAPGTIKVLAEVHFGVLDSTGFRRRGCTRSWCPTVFDGER